MTIIEFNTQRLGFRFWQDRHRKPFIEMGSDPDVMKFFPSLISKEDTNTLIDAQIQKLLEYYMGKNTPQRQGFIIDNLVIEKNIMEESV